jgi:hypothetical protein
MELYNFETKQFNEKQEKLGTFSLLLSFNTSCEKKGSLGWEL